MRRSILSVICLSAVVFACICSFCACNESKEPEKRGEFYTLQEAYDNGILTREDLQTLATAYLCEDRSGVQTTESLTLDKETENAIKETKAYDLRHSEDPIKNANTDGINVSAYYGEYSGAYVVIVTCKYYCYVQAWHTIEIDGISLFVPASDALTVWKAI